MKKPRTSDKAQALEALDYRIYRLKISLAHVRPTIWRRLEVYAGIEVQSLATAIDTLFGWSGEHMGEFEIKGRSIGDGTGWLVEDPRAAKDAFCRPIKLAQKPSGKKQSAQGLLDFFSSGPDQPLEESVPSESADEVDIPTLWETVPRARARFIYTYDEWEHGIKVETIMTAEPGVHYPRCIDGARSNPIEDCGGPWDYQGFVDAVGNPNHERSGDLEEWGLAKWKPERFSIRAADRQLAKVFRRTK